MAPSAGSAERGRPAWRGAASRDTRFSASTKWGCSATGPDDDMSNRFYMVGRGAQESEMPPPRVLLTPAEVADLLRTSRKAIYTMIERAQLPGVTRIGRRVLVRQDALLDFIHHNSAPSPQETRR